MILKNNMDIPQSNTILTPTILRVSHHCSQFTSTSSTTTLATLPRLPCVVTTPQRQMFHLCSSIIAWLWCNRVTYRGKEQIFLSVHIVSQQMLFHTNHIWKTTDQLTHILKEQKAAINSRLKQWLQWTISIIKKDKQIPMPHLEGHLICSYRYLWKSKNSPKNNTQITLKSIWIEQKCQKKLLYKILIKKSHFL